MITPRLSVNDRQEGTILLNPSHPGMYRDLIVSSRLLFVITTPANRPIPIAKIK
jgi:hypothetical protein